MLSCDRKVWHFFISFSRVLKFWYVSTHTCMGGGADAFEYASKSQMQSYFVEVIREVRALLSRNFRYYVNIPDSFFLAQMV